MLFPHVVAKDTNMVCNYKRPMCNQLDTFALIKMKMAIYKKNYDM
jgi:hypothetical protein